MNSTFSNHFLKDREERAAFILSHIDCGTTIKEVAGIDEKGRPYWRELTDTGLIFVYNGEHNKIITMWIASIEQVNMIMGHTPMWLTKVVRKNEKFAKYLKKYVE